MSDESSKNQSEKAHVAIISVGSNIEPEINLQQARTILADEETLLDESQVIQTAPEGFTDQADFLNGAYLVATNRNLNEFKRYLKEVENRMHRVRGPIKSGPRNIDLDLIVWDRKVIHDDYPDKGYVREPIDEVLQRNTLELDL